jgi:hypothetical protein
VKEEAKVWPLPLPLSYEERGVRKKSLLNR